MGVILTAMLSLFVSCASQEAAVPEPGIETLQPTALSIEVSQAELEEFDLTWYTEKELFPLTDLSTLDNKPYDPTVLNDKYVLLNLWASWCPYCAKEKPSIQQLYEEYEGSLFTVLTISLGENQNTVKDYLESNHYSFPVLLNTDNSLRDVYAPRIPTTYLLDTGGTIIARINGKKDWGAEKSIKILKHLMPIGSGLMERGIEGDIYED